MKKLLVLLLAAALLLAAGCADSAPPSIPAADPPTASTPPSETLSPATVSAPETTAPTEPAAAEAPETAVPSEPEASADPEAPADTEAPAETTAAPSTEAPTPIAPVDPWSLLGEASFDQGNFTDELGYSYSWSYDLPCLLADTPDARAINRDIDEVFGGHVREAMQSMEENCAPALLSVGFLGHVWEDILTIEIIEHTEWDFDNYGVYCYSASTGKWLSTADLVERMGFTEAEFLDACREQFRQFYVDLYAELPVDQRADFGYYKGLDRQVTDEFVNMDLLAFPEGDDLVVIAPIVSLAGPDYYYHVIYLGLGGNG
jgi:hypothetical protein